MEENRTLKYIIGRTVDDFLLCFPVFYPEAGSYFYRYLLFNSKVKHEYICIFTNISNVQDKVSFGTTQNLSPLSRGNYSPIWYVSKPIFTLSLNLWVCVCLCLFLCVLYVGTVDFTPKPCYTLLLVLQIVFLSPNNIFWRPFHIGTHSSAPFFAICCLVWMDWGVFVQSWYFQLCLLSALLHWVYLCSHTGHTQAYL